MTFRNMEFDFDIYDADAAEDYEREAKALQAKALQFEREGVRQGEGLSGYIRRQCEAIFAFFDNLLGEGTHRELFGDRVNLRVCLEAVTEFKELVEGQMKTLPAAAPVAVPHKPTRRRASQPSEA